MILAVLQKPLAGYIGAGVSLTSGILTAIKILTPLLGFAGALFGAVTAGLALWMQVQRFLDWRRGRVKIQHKD